MKTLSYLQVVLTILFAMGTHWHSYGCEDAFDKTLEEQTLELAIKAEELLKQHAVHFYGETLHLTINNIRSAINNWGSTRAPLSRIEFITLKENIERLEALLKASVEKTRSGYSGHPVASQKPTKLLNSVVANDMPIESNKLYIVKPLKGNHTFHVVFSTKMAEMINQNRQDIRITKSMRALLRGVGDKWGTPGIKKIISQKHLFEIKIVGKKSIGNFRLGIFLYNGVYYIAGYTHQHIEKNNIFLQGLKRAMMQEATQRKDSIHIP